MGFKSPLHTASVAHQGQMTFIGKGGSQSIPNDVLTPITFGVSGGADDEDFWDDASFPDELRINRVGLFLVMASTTFAANATGYRFGEIYNVGTGGSLLDGGSRIAASPTLETQLEIFTYLRRPSTTLVRLGVRVRQTAGIALDVTNFTTFRIMRIAGPVQ